MSDKVLEILLRRVFRNLKELNECRTEDYSLDTLVRVAQSMPWLESVHSVNPVNRSALLTQLHTSWADIVLGGIVNYLPKCYAVPSSKLFLEYTSGHCYRRPAAGFERSPCTCNIVDSSQRGKLMEDKRCAWVLKVDEYKASNNKVSNIINSVGHSKADNAHNMPQALDLLYSRYHGGPLSSDSNAPVVQGIDIKNKKTRYIGISMWKVIKMTRFHYLKIGQRDGWSQGVQLRFTDYLKKRLSKRDLGNENFISFPPRTRRDPQRGVAEIINCEQGTHLENAHDAPADLLIEAWKHIASIGLSFIPVVGPFLSIGLDVTFGLLQDKSKFDEITKSAEMSAGDGVFKLLSGVASRSIRRF
ncbi:hypothetical protein BG006_005185 [Podila minutissima]|uniref:Uncharacterized protein n=1 Tax=Podila minutissima TaxID=64525 RepID=A0A9P5SKA0_9FUNG|nr:hypothetical protein BG006_005185 [Podila minutissima]